MLFIDLQFLIFFAVILLVYWSIPGNTWRKIFLLLAQLPSSMRRGIGVLSACCCLPAPSITLLAQ